MQRTEVKKVVDFAGELQECGLWWWDSWEDGSGGRRRKGALEPSLGSHHSLEDQALALH
jgi:hypothetical protein